MTISELNAALDLTRKIERLQERLGDLRQSLGHAPEVRVQSSVGVSTAQIAAEIAEEIGELERKREIERVIIQRYIDKLNLDEARQKIMRLRYVGCRPHAQVAMSVGYSGGDGLPTRQYWRMHDESRKTAVGGS